MIEEKEFKIFELANFKIKQLDDEGKEVLKDFEERFETLRKKRVTLPEQFYQVATEFHVTSCAAQTGIPKKALEHIIRENRDDLKIASDMVRSDKWQTREHKMADYIDEQLENKNPLPYDLYKAHIRNPRIILRLKIWATVLLPYIMLPLWLMGVFTYRRQRFIKKPPAKRCETEGGDRDSIIDDEKTESTEPPPMAEEKSAEQNETPKIGLRRLDKSPTK